MPARSITWFPGHMRQAMNALKKTIKDVDLVLEIRDARIPYSSENPELTSILTKKRHLVVLNKADLVPSSGHKVAVRRLEQENLTAMLASCTTSAGVNKVLDAALDWLKRERADSDLSIMMVVGLPNSGKSSFINAVKLASKKRGMLSGVQAHQKKARVGSTPGLTRQVFGFQVCSEPCVYMLDSPGIMIPRIPSDEVGLKLALAGAIKDAIVGEEAIVKYMLHYFDSSPDYALRAIKASGPIAQTTGVQAGRGAERDIKRLRTCLYKCISYLRDTPASGESMRSGVVESGGPWNAISTMHGSMQCVAAGSEHSSSAAVNAVVDVPQVVESAVPPWFQEMAQNHPDLAWQRYDRLMHCLGVAGERNPSAELGAHIRLLKAFREGKLGKYCLDMDSAGF